MPILAKPIPPEAVEHARTKLGDLFFQSGEGCWIYPRAALGNGYVYFGLKGSLYSATRVAVILSGRDLPADRLVCHHCDNPRCVNPEHLFLGTQTNNMRDMRVKGRGGSRPRLSDADMREIYFSSAPPAQIAERFNIARRTVLNIKGHFSGYDQRLADLGITKLQKMEQAA